MVLVLFETAVGFCLFRLNSSVAQVGSSDLYKHFSDPTKANGLLSLHAIHRFTSTAEAVEDASEIGQGKMSKSLKKFLTSQVKEKKTKGAPEQLVVVDPKLGECSPGLLYAVTETDQLDFKS